MDEKIKNPDEKYISFGFAADDNFFVRLIRCVTFVFVMAWVLLPAYMYYYYIYEPEYWADIGYYEIAGLVATYCLGAAIFYFVTQLIRGKFGVLKEIITKPWNLTLLLLFVWCTITTFRQDDLANAFTGNYEAMDGYILVLMCLGLYGASLVIGKLKCVRWIYIAMVAVSTITCLAMLWQYLNPNDRIAQIDPIYASYDNLATVFYNSNIYGYYLSMSVMVIISMIMLSKHILAIIPLVLLLIGHGWVILQHGAFGPILVTAIIMILMPIYLICAKRLKPLRYILIISTAAAVFAGVCIIYRDSIFGGDRAISDILEFKHDLFEVIENPDDEETDKAGTGRWVLWKESIELLRESPIYGYAPMEFKDAMYEKLGGESGAVAPPGPNTSYSPHNELLQYASYYGVPGFLLYASSLLLLTIYQMKRLKKSPTNTVIAAITAVSYIVSSMFGIVCCLILPFFYMFLAFSGNLGGTSSGEDKKSAQHSNYKVYKPARKQKEKIKKETEHKSNPIKRLIEHLREMDY